MKPTKVKINSPKSKWNPRECSIRRNPPRSSRNGIWTTRPSRNHFSEEKGPHYYKYIKDGIIHVAGADWTNFVPTEVYAALCNVLWKTKDGQGLTCSWRCAGAVVAEMVKVQNKDHSVWKDMDYMEFYMNGKEGTVSAKTKAFLAQFGLHSPNPDYDPTNPGSIRMIWLVGADF